MKRSGMLIVSLWGTPKLFVFIPNAIIFSCQSVFEGALEEMIIKNAPVSLFWFAFPRSHKFY